MSASGSPAPLQACWPRITSPEEVSAGSEFDTPPAAMIVHDPVRERAFDAMAEIEDEDRLERTFLFRAWPAHELYGRHHRLLVETLRAHVPAVLHLTDIVEDDIAYRSGRHNPNLVFTRDALITLPWSPRGYIRPRMREPARRSESEVTSRAARRLGLVEIARVPEPLFLEGGDVIPFAREGRRTLLVGYGPRTTVEALDFMQDALMPRHCDEIIGVKLAEWRMNLDGGLLPVAEDVAICDTSSIVGGTLIDGHGRTRMDVLDMLRQLDFNLIDTTPEESILLQSCNCACLGSRRIVYYDLCDRVSTLLVEHGIEVLRVPGSELVKGRGGPRCMTRPIYALPPAASQ